MNLRGAVVASVMSGVVCAAPAASKDVTSLHPTTVVAALQAAGYPAAVETGEDGSPVIDSAVDGLAFSIWFADCAAGADCGIFYFSAGFDLPKGTPLAVIDEWNRGKLVGRAYLDDENDPFLDFVIVGEGRIDGENFAAALRRWSDALAEFAAFVGYR